MNDSRAASTLERFGREYGWTIDDPHSQLPRAAAALSSGARVLFVQETGERLRLPYAVSYASSWEAVTRDAWDFVLVATDRAIDDERCLVFRPKSLVLGIGCRRDISFDALERSVLQTLEAARLSPNSLHSLASLESKRDEAALLAFAEARRLPIRFYTAAVLAAVSGSERGSETVERQVGSRSVCEPAALLAAGARELLVAKTVPPLGDRAITIAIARVPFAPGEVDR